MKIKTIWFPNTHIDQSSFSTSETLKIERIEKNGEMARIGWFQISELKDGEWKVTAEIKESVCDINYE